MNIEELRKSAELIKEKRLNPDAYPSENQKRIYKWLKESHLWGFLTREATESSKPSAELAKILIDVIPDYSPEGDKISVYAVTEVVKRIRAEKQKRVSGRKKGASE